MSGCTSPEEGHRRQRFTIPNDGWFENWISLYPACRFGRKSMYVWPLAWPLTHFKSSPCSSRLEHYVKTQHGLHRDSTASRPTEAFLVSQFPLERAEASWDMAGWDGDSVAEYGLEEWKANTLLEMGVWLKRDWMDKRATEPFYKSN